MDAALADYYNTMLAFKYTIGALEGISAIFMLWAIVKFSLATGRSLTLSELAN